MSNKILVTGSSGFIGTNLCEKLQILNYEFMGLDLNKNKWNENIDSLTKLCDLRKVEDLSSLESFDTVIHLAAHSRVYDLIENPSLAIDNIVILHNILEYCRRNKVKKFIFASSREVYGDLEKASVVEGDEKLSNCESPYSASKVSGEALLRAYHKCFGIEFLILRFSNVYGKYDESNRVIPIFIKNCYMGKEIKIFGESKELDFVYVDDVVDALLKSLDEYDNVKNHSYNIASGKGTKLKILADVLKSITNSEIDINTHDNRKGEIMKYVADINKSEKYLGYSPKVDLETGLALTASWYENQIKGDY